MTRGKARGEDSPDRTRAGGVGGGRSRLGLLPRRVCGGLGGAGCGTVFDAVSGIDGGRYNPLVRHISPRMAVRRRFVDEVEWMVPQCLAKGGALLLLLLLPRSCCSDAAKVVNSAELGPSSLNSICTAVTSRRYRCPSNSYDRVDLAEATQCRAARGHLHIPTPKG